MKDIDHNQRFGQLTAMRLLTSRDSGRRVLWLCLCDCGQETRKRADRLREDVRLGRVPACAACMNKRRIANLRGWQRTRQKGLLNNNPNAPREAITHLNYRKYFLAFSPEQRRRFFAIVEKHKAAAADERFGIDQVKAEAVDLIILEPVPVVTVEISLHDGRNYSYISRGGEI